MSLKAPEIAVPVVSVIEEGFHQLDCGGEIDGLTLGDMLGLNDGLRDTLGD